MTEEEYQELIKGRKATQKKPPKYRNRKVTITDPKTGGEITFDSQKECDYYLELLAREKAGEIFRIERQVDFEIQPAFTDLTGKKHRAITYRADFVYWERINPHRIGDRIVSDDVKARTIDVKGMKTEVYKLKKKLLAYQGVIIEEV